MIHNNKFRDLVDNVFKNIETREITEQLNNLFEKSQIIDNQSKRTHLSNHYQHESVFPDMNL